MYVLGLNTGVHDSSAALLRDGALCQLVEQERLSRRKHAVFQTPREAIQACLDAEGITLSSVDAIAVGWDIGSTPLRGSRRFTSEGMRAWLFPDEPPGSLPPLRWVSHHLAHAASAYYSGGADRAAVIVVDGAGETQASSLYRGAGGKLELLREWPITQSLGFYYGLAAEWVGLDLHFGAGKLMGLAAYGRRRDGASLHRCASGYEIAATRDDGDQPRLGADPRKLGLDVPHTMVAAVREEFAGLYPYLPRAGEDAISYADFAATIQEALNDALYGLAAEARQLADAPDLVVAGGVAMNCSAIGRLARTGIFDRVYVPPVPTDAGVSLGAALVVAAEHDPFVPTAITHAYWSDGFTVDSAAAAVAGTGLVSRRLDADRLPAVAAAAVAEGRIVGWARGRAEIGQRALGARSIVADPRDRHSLERLNRLKGREMWRPVAPSVLAEHAGELFDGPVPEPARFMLSATQVRPDARRRVPAVTHVDGSARPQLVERATNPGYWHLIDEFRALTGIPAVVNTSFNLADEPIVYTAANSVATYLRSDLDLLVLDDLLVARSEMDLSALCG